MFCVYHEAVSQQLNPGVAEGGGGELKITEVAGEDLGGHRHEIVDHVNGDGRGGESGKKLQFSPSRRQEAPAEGQLSVG